jgi:hypothetical protein
VLKQVWAWRRLNSWLKNSIANSFEGTRTFSSFEGVHLQVRRHESFIVVVGEGAFRPTSRPPLSFSAAREADSKRRNSLHADLTIRSTRSDAGLRGLAYPTFRASTPSDPARCDVRHSTT